MAERITLYVVRGLFLLICAGIGLYGAHHVMDDESYIVHFLIGACGVGVVVIAVEMVSAKARASTISAVAFGLIIGLVLSTLFRPVIVLILEALAGEREVPIGDEDTGLRFLQLVTTAIFCYFGVTLLLRTHGRLKFIVPFVEFRKEVKEHRPVLLDTSVLVDGRVTNLLGTGILKCRVLVPTFVVEELHALADSADKLKRERGRRGLELLDNLRAGRVAELVPAVSGPGQADVSLLELAASLGGWVMTTDTNLVARGKVQEVEVVSLNEVADALRIQAVPGQELHVNVLRKGEEDRQGVGFLPDGTMVVVEDGEGAIGKSVRAEVTGTIRTSAGRIVFAKVLTVQ